MQKKFFLIPVMLLFHILCPAGALAASFAGPSIVPGLYEIVSTLDTDYVLDLRSCTVKETDSHTLQLFRSLDINQQKYYVEQLPGSAYRLSNLYSAEALTADIPGAAGSDSDDASSPVLPDAAVSLQPLQRSSGSAAPAEQSWELRPARDGSFYIRSGAAGLYLTLDSSLGYNGAPVILKKFTGGHAQKWTLKKTWISGEDTADTDLVNPYGEDGPYRNIRIVMHFGTRTELLTAATLSDWITETDHHEMVFDEEALKKYVEGLAEKYNTQGEPRKFRTSYGKEITLYKGNFGWSLDADKTLQAIRAQLQSEGRCSVPPVWKHKGTSFTKGNDIGDSYVEVDLVNQKVWLYKDGEQLLATECVSGTYGTERQTPGGVYSIYYMQSPAVLHGADYATPVDYWMPFNGGIGLHDANWRSEFGGEIFRTNGSHGCINLPVEDAGFIYENVYVGYPVVCYN